MLSPGTTSDFARLWERGWTTDGLSQVGLFSGCNKQELRAWRLCTPLSVQKDFVLTTRGDPGSECLITFCDLWGPPSGRVRYHD